MHKNPFGTTGLHVSPLGFGGAPIGFLETEQARVHDILHLLLDGGVNVIDTAAMYQGSEELIGKAIGSRRDEYVLISKCGQQIDGCEAPAWSPETIAASVDRSLQRLKTDRIDVMLLHTCDRAVLEKRDALAALAAARDAGKICFAGFSGDNEDAAYAATLDDIAVLEISVSIADQVNIDTVIPTAQAHGVGIIAKRPIANTAWRPAGELRGFYGDYAKPYAERLVAMGLHPGDLGFGGTPDEVWPEIALRFTLAHSDTAIIGTTNPSNAKSNIAAAERGPLPAPALARLREAFRDAELRSGEKWPGLT